MNNVLAEELLESFYNSLSKWYPLSVDKINGGYFTNISYDWKLLRAQDKMIVTQARHIWTSAKAAGFCDRDFHTNIAVHGFKFMKDKMWDEKYGGFYQIRDAKGKRTSYHKFEDEKRTYGNAFGLYGLAALYNLTGDEEILDFGKQVFNWIEIHAADPDGKGYFQFITREGQPFGKEYKTKAADAKEAGYKDQNSSIHLLEAYTELYHAWKDDQLKQSLQDVLLLVRDVIRDEKGYLHLFFDRQWNPLSFRDAPEKIRKANYSLEHVSFGHDYETAFLMLEASYTLGLENDKTTLLAAKKMLDHAIKKGWDDDKGGFFDQGYYFSEDKFEIIKPTKVWWAQAEALNVLLLFYKIFPGEKHYYEKFLKLWEYIKEYLIDKENGEWYWASLEKEPDCRYGPKANIWKCNYHTGRALMNCFKMLSDESAALYQTNVHFRKEKIEFDNFIEHWRKTAQR